jgi:branched-chain amino acid transport system substrate-binding protein
MLLIKEKNRRRNMKKFLTLLLVVVIAILITGCKKDDGQQGVTDKSVKVGNCVATSGSLAPVGVPFKTGIEAYFKMINDEGGVNGRKINYVHQDAEWDTSKAKACVEKMIEDEKIFAFVGHFGTPLVGATLNDIKKAGIPSVYFATGTGILYNENAFGQDRGIYPVQPVYPMEGRIMTAWANGQFEASKLGVIYTNDDAGKDLLNGVNNQVAAIGGMSVVAVQVAPAAEDVAAAVQTIIDAKVDVVIIAAIQGTFPQIAKELASQGNTKPAITTYVNASIEMTNNVKEEIGTMYSIYANSWVDVVSNQDSVTEYAEWIAKVDGNDDYSANAYAMTGWIAGHFFVEGLKAIPEGDEVTWESYMDAIESSPIKNPFGGLIDYSEGKRLGTQEMALSIMDPNNPIGWSGFQPMQSIDDILANNN